METKEQMKREEIQQILNRNRKYTEQGKVADYIPELSHVDPTQLGVTVATSNGEVISLGDCDAAFTFQSISKVIGLLVALLDHGPEKVFSKVGMEPSGDPCQVKWE
jgi:glutaminase